MIRKVSKVFTLLAFFLSLAPLLPASQTSLPFDHSLWDQFLKKFVNEKGKVNYQAVQKDSTLLDAYLEKLKQIPSKEFQDWPREERMAVFINAYNAGVVKKVIEHYPLKTVMSVPGFWDDHAVAIGTLVLVGGRNKQSQMASLNQIQQEFLRAGFRDEKLLFSLSSAAQGSPRLRREAYVGPRLEGQLYDATREFVNLDHENQIHPAEKKVVLSKLFKWYADDFLLNWGNFPEDKRWKADEMAVLSFFAHYLDDPKKVEFLREGKYKVKYQTFDWRLNEWKGR